MKHHFLPIAAILFGFGFPLLAKAQAELSSPQLLEALQQGGLVLYVRHGATDFGQTDFWQQGGNWSRETLFDCSRQRNLSAAGREQVRGMGRAIARLKLPWGAVLASPYCRTRETAEAAFGKAEVSWDLFYHQAARSRHAEDGEAILTAVRRLLGTPPAPGSNTVLVSHGGNLSAVAGVFLAEGETAVFRPGQGGEYTLIAKIMPEDWARLAPPESPAARAHRESLQRRWIFRHADRDMTAGASWRRK